MLVVYGQKASLFFRKKIVVSCDLKAFSTVWWFFTAFYYGTVSGSLINLLRPANVFRMKWKGDGYQQICSFSLPSSLSTKTYNLKLYRFFVFSFRNQKSKNVENIFSRTTNTGQVSKKCNHLKHDKFHTCHDN